jgi:hypothetical protein
MSRPRLIPLGSALATAAIGLSSGPLALASTGHHAGRWHAAARNASVCPKPPSTPPPPPASMLGQQPPASEQLGLSSDPNLGGCQPPGLTGTAP